MKKIIVLACCWYFCLNGYAQKQLYVVQSGDNLSQIAVQFGMNVSDLKKMNDLSNDNIRQGQKIWINPTKNTVRPRFHVVDGGESLYKIASHYQVSMQDLKTWNNLATEQLSVGQKLQLSPNLPEEIEKSSPKVAQKLIREVGMGASIPPTDSNAKLALHASAPAGTIVQVHNESQRKSVSVRVIGKLSPADINRQVIIKLSQAACKTLGVVNTEFPVVLVYKTN